MIKAETTVTTTTKTFHKITLDTESILYLLKKEGFDIDQNKSTIQMYFDETEEEVRIEILTNDIKST